MRVSTFTGLGFVCPIALPLDLRVAGDAPMREAWKGREANWSYPSSAIASTVTEIKFQLTTRYTQYQFRLKKRCTYDKLRQCVRALRLRLH